MPLLLGIDLGTSSAKAVLFDADSGQIAAVGQREYPIRKPAPDRAEQDPDDWWEAAAATVNEALDQARRRDVAGISLCGQMHGTTMLGADNRPIAPSIIWPDQRCPAEVQALVDLLGAQRYTQIAGTMPATGFMAPTLLWLKHHDPALLDKIRCVLLPKDYVRLKLTGEVATDPSDAAATGLFDIAAKTWSAEIIRGADLPKAIFPAVIESQAVAGELIPAAAERLGLKAGIPVIAGCADQPAQAISSGIIAPGKASVTIGSGGQVCTPLRPADLSAIPTDPRLHVFNHAVPGMWYILGAILSAGLSLRWLRGVMGLESQGKAAYEQFSSLAAEVHPGSDGLIFLPYLTGERTPLMDPLARAGFIGLTAYHTQGHLARAVMEGVACAMRQALEISLELGGQVETVIAAGGGMESDVWRQIMADVLGLPLRKSLLIEQTGVGAALLAGVGIGRYGSFEEASAVTAHYGSVTEPIPERVALYDRLYAEFCALYPRLKEDFHTLAGFSG